MSTHNLDVSGQRALTMTVNDPARTAAQCNAKQGDDVAATLSGFSELRLELPENARIQRRRYIRKDVVYENGKPVKRTDARDGESAYETVDVPYDTFVVVLSSATLFGRTSHLPSEGAPDPPAYEATPHTNIVAKRWGAEPHFLESGELIFELVGLEDLVPKGEATTD